ncbi:MAG: glycosyltransferase family 39 protein [Candidatus Binatia bacterium]
MNRKTFLACGVAMTITAVLVRLNNALVVSVLAGYDAFAHITYVWFLAETGRVPLAEAGWEFFQPPLYYAVMASIWRTFDTMDPILRLRLGTALIAMLGLAQAAVALAIVRRRFPREYLVQLLAAGLMLFVPVHLYSSGFVGNEGLTAALCATSLWLLLRALEQPSAARAAALGFALGLAMLTKFTAIVVVAAAVATIGLKGLLKRDAAGAARSLAVVAAVLVAVCGWYYARNISIYGTPFQLSRDQLFLQRVENSQLQGKRHFLEYVLFDPGVLYRPQWPRGLSLNSPRPPGAAYSAMRESIPTGLYANAWFDGFGGFALPPVTYSEASRRAGQLLLTLAVIPTGVMLLGFLVAIRSLLRKGWDDATVSMLFALAAMAAVLVQGTRTVPTQAAVKATYLMPVSVAFSYLLALGLHDLSARAPRVLRAVAIACALLGAASALVFTRGLVIGDGWFRTGVEAPLARNLYGVIDYAAGDVEGARTHFEASALGGWHIGYENLATLALERGEPEAAAWFMLTAASLQPGQTRGSIEERRRAIAITQAEYASSMGVIYERLGRREDAFGAVRRSMRLDPTIPEARYNLGVLALLEALATRDVDRVLVEDAARAFERSLELDPAFREAAVLRGVALAFLGDCSAALPLLTGPGTSEPGSRRYAVETGPGDLNAAGLHRRRRIDPVPRELSAQSAIERCRGT